MKRFALLTLLLAIAACGGDSSSPTQATATPPPTPSRGQYSVTVTPSPILATSSGNPEFPWNAAWRVTIADVAGLSGNVNRVVTTARNNFGFTFTVSDYNPDAFLAGIGTNHINASGNLSYSDHMTYRADGNGGQQLVLTVAAEIIDDSPSHNRITASTDVRITANGVERLD